MLLKKFSLAFLFVCLFGSLAFADISNPTPMKRVQEGADQLIKMLSNPDMQDPEKHDSAVAELRTTAEQYIDFRLVTMYAVGKPWLKMSKQMQGDLTEAFVQLLERTYLKRIPAYGGQNVDYVKELISGKKAKVFTEIVDKDKKISVEFRLKYTGNQWMIYDVVAEGVSLVANYRSQFSEILNQGTAEDLIKLLRERVEKLEKGQADSAEDKIQG